jgi:hypothetical protein
LKVRNIYIHKYFTPLSHISYPIQFQPLQIEQPFPGINQPFPSVKVQPLQINQPFSSVQAQLLEINQPLSSIQSNNFGSKANDYPRSGILGYFTSLL